MTTHSAPAHSTTQAHAVDDHFSHHVRRYLFVFYALLFGTLITVGASYIPFGNHAINIAVALFIS